MGQQIMNSGWHRGGFSVPEHNNTMPMWADELALAYRRAFDFDWLSGGRMMRFEYQPLVQRESGMPNLGGTYEHCILRFDPKETGLTPSNSPIVSQLLELGASNGPAPMEPNGFNVTVHSGAFSEDALHWVEMYDPYAFERVRMSVPEFAALSSKLVAQAEAELQSTMSLLFVRVNAGDANAQRAYQRVAQFGHLYLTSKSLLLASFFADRRIPLTTIMQVLLWMPTFAAAHKCVSELPDDGSADQLPMRKLVLLYGSEG